MEPCWHLRTWRRPLGQRVAKGQVLGQIAVQWGASDRVQLENQAVDAERTIREVEAELAVARDRVQRLRTLASGAVAGKSLVEASANLSRLEAQLEAAREKRRVTQPAISSLTAAPPRHRRPARRACFNLPWSRPRPGS